MKVILIGYRSWAISAFQSIANKRKDIEFMMIGKLIKQAKNIVELADKLNKGKFE